MSTTDDNTENPGGIRIGVSACLLEFHASHKLLVMSHSTVVYRQLGHLLSDLNRVSLHATADFYINRLLQTLAPPGPAVQKSALVDPSPAWKKLRQRSRPRRLNEDTSSYEVHVVAASVMFCF